MPFFLKTPILFAMFAAFGLGAAGCMMQAGDETAGEGSQALETALFTCNGGWPGRRSCYQRIGNGREIVPESVKVLIIGRDGSAGYGAPLSEGNRVIAFSADIHEGDLFNPGKNSTMFLVLFEYR